MSSTGVLFATDAKIEVGEPIEYVISLAPSSETPNGVNLHCLGKVTRLDTPADGWQDAAMPFAVAVTLERYEFVRTKTA